MLHWMRSPRVGIHSTIVGANTARELAGWEEFIYQFDVGEYYLTTGHVLGYSHSLHADRIARAFFGDSVLHFVGSQVENRPVVHYLLIISDYQPILEDRCIFIQRLKIFFLIINFSLGLILGFAGYMCEFMLPLFIPDGI